MRVFIFILSLLSVIALSGCSATWSGVKEDTSNAVNWTKEKVDQGASYVREKTE